jgi:hypothetical protein
LTSIVPSGSATVMWPERFSLNPTPARMRKAHASACSGVRSTPMGGVIDGCQAWFPPAEGGGGVSDSVVVIT